VAGTDLRDRADVDGGGPPPDRPPDQPGSAVGELRGRLAKLDSRHPSGPGYLDAVQRPDPRDFGPPLADEQYAVRAAEVGATLADWRGTYRGTEFQYTLDDSHKVWSAERAARHDEIIQHLYAGAANVPCEGKAIITGGLPGAGKTTVLAGVAGIDRSQYLVVNPDGIKEQLAQRHMVPVIPGLSPMEATDLAHEESSYIAKQLALRAYADRKNVIWDITMSNPDTTHGRIRELRAAGYVDVEAIFIDIPVEVSLSRTEARHRKEHDAYRAGDGLGGRYIPPDLISAQAHPDASSTNRATFDQAKQQLPRWRLFDNSVDGRDPALIETGANRGWEEPA
jgi:predicted kinase